jgi:hypothetical protein
MTTGHTPRIDEAQLRPFGKEINGQLHGFRRQNADKRDNDGVLMEKNHRLE